MKNWTNKEIIFNIFIIVFALSGVYILLCTEIEIWKILLVMVFLLSILDAFKLFNKRFSRWLEKCPFKYYLKTEDDLLMWNSIVTKAMRGYDEWIENTNGNDMCGPALYLNKKEQTWLDTVHTKIYGDSWVVTIPISAAQVNYVMYEDLLEKIDVSYF